MANISLPWDKEGGLQALELSPGIHQPHQTSLYGHAGSCVGFSFLASMLYIFEK